MTAPSYKSQKPLIIALQVSLVIWLVQSILLVLVWLEAAPISGLSVYSLPGLAASLILTIGFPVFFSRATKNLGALGVSGLNYSSGQAAWSFFIPFVNLVRPYRVARDLVRASLAGKPNGYSTGWLSGPAAPRWVLGWFVAFMCAHINIKMTPGYLAEGWGKGYDGFLIFMTVALALKVLAFGPGVILARRLLVTIHEAQEAMANPPPVDDGELLREGLGHVAEQPASTAAA